MFEARTLGRGKDVPDDRKAASQALPPHVQLIQMGVAFWGSRVVYTAARLGIADFLAEGSKSAAQLAASIQADAPSLHRLMRAMASMGILQSMPNQIFALTLLGEALRTNAPGAARASLLTFGSPWSQSASNQLEYSVQTGKTGFERVHGMPFFDYLAQHPDDASLFSETMVGLNFEDPPAVAEAYDFSTFEKVVDIGGATGNMLAAILTRHNRLHGVLFDRPHVVGQAPALLEKAGVSDRIVIKAGDFFSAVPGGGDAYILSHIIHDWREDLCLAILDNIRKAMRPDGRLLIVEMVLPADGTPHPGTLLDMVMLALTGGQERTEDEYRALLTKAGFHLIRVVPTASAVSVVEASLA